MIMIQFPCSLGFLSWSIWFVLLRLNDLVAWGRIAWCVFIAFAGPGHDSWLENKAAMKYRLRLALSWEHGSYTNGGRERDCMTEHLSTFDLQARVLIWHLGPWRKFWEVSWLLAMDGADFQQEVSIGGGHINSVPILGGKSVSAKPRMASSKTDAYAGTSEINDRHVMEHDDRSNALFLYECGRFFLCDVQVRKDGFLRQNKSWRAWIAQGCECTDG